MTTVKSFVNRLAKIGIEVELFGNYHWVYLDKVNGIKVKGLFMGNHGFTVFLGDKMPNIPVVFKKIREIISG